MIASVSLAGSVKNRYDVSQSGIFCQLAAPIGNVRPNAYSRPVKDKNGRVRIVKMDGCWLKVPNYDNLTESLDRSLAYSS